MAQIGSIKVQTASGLAEIPVFELADVTNNYLRVQTASGVGAINLVDPVDAELSYIRVQTASGVKAVSNSIISYALFESFEDGNKNGWTVLDNGFSGWTNEIRSDWSTDGTYSMYGHSDGATSHKAIYTGQSYSDADFELKADFKYIGRTDYGGIGLGIMEGTSYGPNDAVQWNCNKRDGKSRLRYYEGGTKYETDIGWIPADGSVHTYTLRYQGGTLELLIDGSSQGTYSRSWGGYSNMHVYLHFGEVNAQVDNIVLEFL